GLPDLIFRFLTHPQLHRSLWPLLGARSLDDFVCGLGDCAGAAFGDQVLHPSIRKSKAQASDSMS
ncbi:hypothetical protein CAY96_35320, partial [Pseudomonas aeruginosa]|uniref:hypothetical protein n=1 Tax=Pseudomonas aeruginosa TaxID=287 RepID=UPI000B6A20F9